MQRRPVLKKLTQEETKKAKGGDSMINIEDWELDYCEVYCLKYCVPDEIATLYSNYTGMYSANIAYRN